MKFPEYNSEDFYTNQSFDMTKANKMFRKNIQKMGIKAKVKKVGYSTVYIDILPHDGKTRAELNEDCKAVKAMTDLYNYDNSDVQSDYFDQRFIAIVQLDYSCHI